MHAFGDSRRTRLSADDKWKNVSDYCRSKGVQRTKEQCRVKWDNMMPDYRKVRDYEEQKEPNAPSYFEMDVWERRMKLLPSNMDAEIYLRIASIQTSKPPKGGLKREAREKRSLEYSHMLATSLQSLGHLSNGFESINGIDYGGERPLADHVGQHIASSTPKRRRRRRAADFAFPIERKPEALNRIDLGIEPVARADVEIHDSSSTEDDAAVVNSRSQQGTPSTACLYAERSSFILSQGTNHESRDVLPVAYRSQNTIQQAGSVAVERGNNVVLGGSAARGTCLKETANGTSNHDATNHGEDRKDARHRELMELEREKLAVFREATCAIANAMTNAMAVFSKVAEELLLRRR
ncbi:hypothetical protein KP509_1Z010500 [Ceratopteris richardii]|nr:hypothetical protein KP509_1Z010500 [Ceratopteris richardii]